MNEDLLLLKRLESLRTQHRQLDQQIKDTFDPFTRKRMQQLKLHIRDEMHKLEQLIYPDIIA